MQTAIDKFGRVVIPKTVRDHLGLKPGSILYIEESNNDIILKAVELASPIKVKEGVAVYVAHALEDVESTMQNEREERLKKLGDME